MPKYTQRYKVCQPIHCRARCLNPSPRSVGLGGFAAAASVGKVRYAADESHGADDGA